MSPRPRLACLVVTLWIVAGCQISGAAIALDDFHTVMDRAVTEIDVLANDYITGSDPTIEVLSGPSCGHLISADSTLVVTGMQQCEDVVTLTYRVVDEYGSSGEAIVEIALPGHEPKTTTTEPGQANLVPDPLPVEFGDVENETIGRQLVIFENVGTASVEVSDVVTTPEAEFGVAASDCERVIGPGESCSVSLIFTPSAELGAPRFHQGVLELLDQRAATVASVGLIGRSFEASPTTTTGSTTSTSIPGGGCVDFEDLSPRASFVPGDVFAAGGVAIEVSDFTLSDGTVYSDGEVGVTEGYAGGTGNELFPNNALLRFGFPSTPLDGLSLDFGAHGGNLNIEVNDDFVNFSSISDIDGDVIGGVSVSVFLPEFEEVGSLVLTGTIDEFAIGGQEFAIDNLCP